jgi:hypothetical protein
MAMYISRHYRDDHIKSDSFETSVSIYEDQVRGWFFDQARILDKASDHAGFVTLLVVLSYIEGHAIFFKGEDSKQRSKEFFRHAFKEIFLLSGDDPKLKDDAIDELYDQMRNGLFHTGITRGKVRLSYAYQTPVNLIIDLTTKKCVQIEINPRLMLDGIEDHFSHYLMRLRNANETLLRENFLKAWRMRG